VRGQGNTWAAYQCYGDPEWTLRRERKTQRPTPPADKFAGISSPLGLAIALETVAVETRFLRADEREARIATQRERLAWLDSRFGPEWGGMGAVAEAFAVAYNEAGDAPRALDWYGRAVAANDGSASQRASEQWANLRARVAEEQVRQAGQARDEARRRRARRGAKAGQKESGALAAAESAVHDAALAARGPLREALSTLEQLIALQPTIERESLAWPGRPASGWRWWRPKPAGRPKHWRRCARCMAITSTPRAWRARSIRRRSTTRRSTAWPPNWWRTRRSPAGAGSTARRSRSSASAWPTARATTRIFGASPG
jgi:hypothetical protein